MIDLTTGGYATVANLDRWIGTERTTADDAIQLLRWASFIVARATNRNPYSDSPDAADAQALADATCAQADPWNDLPSSQRPWTVSTGLTAGTAPVKKSSILGADVEVDTSGQVKAISDADCLVGEAEAILLQAGLLWLAVPLGDPAPHLPRYGLSGPHDYGWGSPLAEWPCWS